MKRKKWAIILVSGFCLLSMISLSLAKETGRTLEDLPSGSLIKQSDFADDDSLKRLFLYPETDFNEKEALETMDSVQSLPISLLEKTVEKGVRIRLFEGKLTDNPSAAHLKGKVPRGYVNPEHTWDDVPGMGGSRIVLVKIGANSRGNGHNSVNLELHELAHSLDKVVYGGIREKPDFQAIWKQEVENVFPGQAYFVEYPEEYFAECFALFYVSKEQNILLKRFAPRTYQYIKALD